MCSNTLRAVARSALLLSAATCAHAQADDAAAIKAVVHGFHQALEAGAVDTAADLLAEDAVILEGGELETRQQYLEHHLQADIQFAQAVATRHGEIDVTLNDDVAWTHASSETEGRYHDRPIHLNGVESMVLSRTPDGWRIRSIHWSSHKATP